MGALAGADKSYCVTAINAQTGQRAARGGWSICARLHSVSSMIRAAVAVLASADWTATPIFLRSTTRRRHAVGADGQQPTKVLQTPALRAVSSSTSTNCCRMNSTLDRETDPAVIELGRIGHPHPRGRRGGSESSDVYQALIASGIFSKVDPDKLSTIAEQIEPVQFSPGDVMVAQSNRGGRVYVIIAGKVKVAYRRPEGGEMVLTILGPKEIFGAITLFDPEAHEITAIALTEVVAAPIERDQFLLWITRYPEFSEQLLRLFARWVKASMNSLVDFAFDDVQSRVANQLLLLRKRFGRLEGDVVRVVHDLTLEDFSLLVGVAPEAICETLREFEDRGWIRLEDTSVVVVDAHSLSTVSRVSQTSTPEVQCV